MFNRAVQSHQSASGKSAQPLRQQTFTPLHNAPWSDNGTATYKPPHSIPDARAPFKPSSSAVVNGPAAASFVSGNVGTKKSHSGVHGFPTALHKDDSFREEVQALKSTGVMTSSSVPEITSLHDAVYFDENDFENDSDLDLSAEYFAPKTLKEALTAPKAPPRASAPLSNSKSRHLSPPPAPTTASIAISPELSSSAPIPWSSSPAEHKKTPPNAGLLQRQAPSGEFVHPKRPSPPQEPDSRPGKRRTLPWLEENAKTSPPGRENVPSIPNNTPRNPTPLWNKTYSAVKEEQKRMKKAKRPANSDQQTGVSRRKVKVDFVQLSQEQRNVLDLVVNKEKSVFFTGSAGTGKSVLLRQIIAELRRKHARDPDRVAVTASTGLAACNIGGVTLHSFGGIGLGKEAVPELVKKIKKNPKAKTRWLRTKFLIIDEISMVDGDLFDKLEGIARQIRNNGRPFGGIKLVVTGDFFQLPPVPDSGKIAKFAFDAGTWKLGIDHTIGLTHVFRQKDPGAHILPPFLINPNSRAVFARMLNEMRIGKLTQESIATFKSLSRPINYDDGVQATELFPTRTEVDRANTTRMTSLSGPTQIFTAMDGGTITDIKMRDKLLSNCMAPIRLELRKGSQVMLIKNIDESLVNGSLGLVVGFMDDKSYTYREENGDDTEDLGADDDALKLFKKKMEKLRNGEGQGRLWPLVRFQLADGTSRELLCQPESWKIELPNGEVQASRSQVPLILAWALSIHKAQGQTLERVKVDLGKVFEKGQAYVALSRATRQDGLQVLNFDPRKVMAHPTVTRFYNDLYTVDEALAGTASNKGNYSADTGRGRSAARRDIVEIDDEEEAMMSAYG